MNRLTVRDDVSLVGITWDFDGPRTSAGRSGGGPGEHASVCHAGMGCKRVAKMEENRRGIRPEAMKLRFWSIALLLAASLSAVAGGIDGVWTAEFTDPPGRQPITVDKAVFEIRQEGNKLAGTAHLGSWPGDAPITDGKIEGRQFSFTVVGDSPWRSNAGVGYPKIEFTGTIEGEEITLTLKWGSIMAAGNPNADVSVLHMKGRRTAAQ